MDSLENFVDVYIGTALEIVQGNGSLNRDDFDNFVFENVSTRTGFSIKDVKYLHHVFHWNLFLRSYSPLEIVVPLEVTESYQVRLKKDVPKKSELVSHILEENREWLKARLERIGRI